MSLRFAKLNIYTRLYGNTSKHQEHRFIHSLARSLTVQPRHSKQIITTYTERVCIFFVVVVVFLCCVSSRSRLVVGRSRNCLSICLCVQVLVRVCVCLSGIHCGLGVRARCSAAQTSSVDACVLELAVTQWNLMKT